MTPMTLWQIIALIVGAILAAAMAWVLWAEQARREKREQRRDIQAAQLVEMTRSVSEMCDAMIKYLEAQAVGQRRILDESIENFFITHKGQADIMRLLRMGRDD